MKPALPRAATVSKGAPLFFAPLLLARYFSRTTTKSGMESSARLLSVSGKMQIARDLEGHAQIVAVLRQACFVILRCAGQYPAELRGDGKQAGGLAEDEVEVLVARDAAAELFHLQQFAFHHLLRERNQQVQDV